MHADEAVCEIVDAFQPLIKRKIILQIQRKGLLLLKLPDFRCHWSIFRQDS